jgi:hypothetical protein
MQRAAGVKPKNLRFPVSDVETRWNSTYFMAQRLLELKTHVCKYLLEHTDKLVRSVSHICDWDVVTDSSFMP